MNFWVKIWAKFTKICLADKKWREKFKKLILAKRKRERERESNPRPTLLRFSLFALLSKLLSKSALFVNYLKLKILNYKTF